MSKLLAYHGSQAIKDKYVARMQAHIDADELIRGIGFKNGKGCAVGCTLNSYDHAEYETKLGIPKWLALVEESLFEGMNLEKSKTSKTFPLIFLQTIQPNMDLGAIEKPFKIYILLEEALSTFDNEQFPAVRDCIHQVIALHNTEFESESAAWSAESAWSAARSAAYSAAYSAESAADSAAWSAAWSAESAAESAAYSAAYSAARSARSAAESAAESAARSAAESAAWSAESAAYSAAKSAAYSAARSAAFDKYAAKLLELIRACPVIA